MLKEEKISPNKRLLLMLAVACFLYALYVAVRYANQTPLDQYSFRQTQTALTAFWFVKNGFSLSYETPVAGPPWSIPFEFPLYQYVVALGSRLSSISLNTVGRLVSFIFLALCLIPVRSITRNLKFPLTVFYIFVVLLFSSPLYLYYGRTFMIETTAVFFSVVAIKYFIDIIQGNDTYKNKLLYFVFIVLSILQKATTGLPVLALLCLTYLILNIREMRFSKVSILSRAISAVVYFALPLVVGVVWTVYTDHVKELNQLGMGLTSSALNNWNWGTLSQRLSFVLYDEVIWRRIFVKNLSGVLGMAILIGVLFSKAKAQIKFTVVVSSLMGLVPLFLFTNLHIVHTYYQTSNLIFLIYAVAVSLGCMWSVALEKAMILPIVAIMVTSNFIHFSKDYLGTIKAIYSKEDSRDYAVSEILKREIPQGKSFVAFGNDWSSSFAYLSERKSFTVPPWIKKYKEICLHPEQFIEKGKLGAVVLCSPIKSQSIHDLIPPSINDLINWSTTNRSWKIGEVHGCYVATPEIQLVNTKEISQAQCQGSIDLAGEIQIENSRFLSITGWTTISGEKSLVPERVFLTMKKGDSEPIFLETLKVNRADVNAHFGQPNYSDSGFSRILSLNSLNGQYVFGVARLNNGHLESCQFQKEVFINSGNSNE